MGAERGVRPFLLAALTTLNSGPSWCSPPWLGVVLPGTPSSPFLGAPGDFRVSGTHPQGGLLPIRAAVEAVVGSSCWGPVQVPGAFARSPDQRDSWVPQTCDSYNTMLLPHPASKTDDFLKRG